MVDIHVHCTGGYVRSACTVKKEMNSGRGYVYIILDIMFTWPSKILPSGLFGIYSNSVLGI
jgi:hypothetical protein